MFMLAAAGAARGQQTLADLLGEPGVDLGDPATRARVVDRARGIAEQRRQQARQHALAMGLPLRVVHPHGVLQEIVGLADGQPVYFTTDNANAAISTGANLVRSSHAVDGAGVLIGMWDGGAGRPTHQEFGARMVVMDGAAVVDHATHVGGTLAAAGVVAGARGMAPAGVVHSYDWNGDTAEMTARGATGPGQADKLYLSNHSYSYVSGWNDVSNATRVWEWYGNGTDAAGIEQDFGRYNTYARDQDALAASAPFYLVFRSAGNERTDNPSSGQNVALAPGGTTVVAYDPASHPAGDGQYRGGFETISFAALAKNVLTVGSVNDAVTSGVRDTAKAAVCPFSSWGPTDDGRVKPDVVANGYALYSSLGGSNTAYGNYSGTSMASPNACGTAALLVHLYGNLFPGQAMRSSTLRGLLIHTADDLGNPGPDYKSGWGLVDALDAANLLADHHAYPAKQRLTEGQLTTSAPGATYAFVWDGVSPLRATLCWTDPTGTATSTSDLRTPRLVNNLNLRIIGPGGAEFLPWVMPFVGDWSQAAMNAPATTGVNNTDNVEQVLIAAPPAAGVYQAVVGFAGTLANGSQHYSLLLSGASAEPPPPPPLAVTAVAPASAFAGPVTLELTGAGFRADTAVMLARAGQPDIAAAAVALAGGILQCQFDLSGAASGAWDVVATNPDNETSTLPGAFTILGALWSASFDGATPPAGWASQADTGSNSWTVVSTRSHSPANSWFAPGPASKTTTSLESPAIPIPPAATDIQLRFWHDFHLQTEYDGGRIEFSLDGGAWFDVAGSGSGAVFASNGYTTATIKGTGAPSGRSEFYGLPAWSGSSNGFIETIVNLTDTARYAGHALRIRWRLATDGSIASPGWYVDTVALLCGGDLGNQPPVITGAADSASTETVTDPDTTVFEVVRDASVGLTVAASDDGGEAGLTYTWSVTDGPGTPVSFAGNGTNAAKQTTAFFEGPGDHRLAVAVSDPQGLTVTSAVNVRVLQQASGLDVIPEIASVVVGATEVFGAVVRDQFGVPLVDEPTSFAWAVSGGGSIAADGLFTATTAGGPFVITATNNGFSGTANVTVIPADAAVLLGDLTHTYDGTPKSASVTTEPPGLAVALTYNQSPDPPIAVGSYAVEAVVTDPNYEGVGIGTLVISPPDFTTWQDRHFTTEEQAAGLAAPDQDPDHDGIANLLEYALGTDPRAANPPGLAAVLQPDELGVERLTVAFTRPAGLFDVSYAVEVADHPGAASWQELTEMIAVPGDPPDAETVTAMDNLPVDDAPRRFVRLRVTLVPAGG